jgi:subtilisin family serine protease
MRAHKRIREFIRFQLAFRHDFGYTPRFMRLVPCLLLLLNALAVFGQNALPNLRPPYAPMPADRYYTNQWHLEQRDPDGVRFGADLNVRGAWERTKGEGVIVAIIDDGVDLAHRDLATNGVPEFHFDFELSVTNGNHRTDQDNHGTATAGIVAAELNGKGVVGVAPNAKFASWNIHPTNSLANRSVVLPEKMAKVFTYQTNTIAVQMHNWSEVGTGFKFFGPTALESESISNAVTFGRDGKGVVMVRPAGNVHFNPNTGEFFGRNVNDDAFASDPRVITASAARNDGRVTSYADRGACILVAGLSGDFTLGFPNIFTTDRTGTLGMNAITFPSEPELSDYVFGSLGFTGTSASAPMISGICALILSANPDLTYRDVQQILIHASRHIDKADPDLRRNGAGYWVDHHTGFGIPDAAEAVRLAENWHNVPALVRRTYASDITTNVPIPDASLRVQARAASALPPIDQSFVAFPSLGPQPDDPTPDVPLVDVGLAVGPISQDLHGKGALIQRGTATFSTKINNAAAAGAEFVVMYNNTTNPPLSLMAQTDFVPVPAVMIRKTDGETLQNLITNQPSLRVQLLSTPAVARFNVTDQLRCEHVGVRIRTTHPIRQDLRITLVSPMGTRSVLQAFNLDTSAGPVDWTYWTVQNFYELSSGSWTLEVTDQIEGSTGDLVAADLIVEGAPIVDLDDDGLDDVWEIAHFGNLNQGPLDDPDGDGSWNAREQALGTNPAINETPFALSAADLQPNAVRFAFPSVEGVTYSIRSTTDLNQPFSDVGTTVGEFGETEIISDKGDVQRFFLVRRP